MVVRSHNFPESHGNKKPGDVLLSHAVTHIVPSTLQGLTAVFGKGTGVAPAQLSPGILVHLTVGRAQSARAAVGENRRSCRESDAKV